MYEDLYKMGGPSTFSDPDAGSLVDTPTAAAYPHSQITETFPFLESDEFMMNGHKQHHSSVARGFASAPGGGSPLGHDGEHAQTRRMSRTPDSVDYFNRSRGSSNASSASSYFSLDQSGLLPGHPSNAHAHAHAPTSAAVGGNTGITSAPSGGDSTTSTAGATGSQTHIPLDPLSRTYPKPVEEIDVEEALRREPGRWTLAYWAKNAKDRRAEEAGVVDKASAAGKLEEAKRELLRAKAEMAGMRFGGR